MPRPCCLRHVGCAPTASYFKPAGIPLRDLEEVVLALDELEALRLADHEGHYHQAAAKQMRVSRATFGRIIESARRKVADALVGGLALRIEGGPVRSADGAAQRTPVKPAANERGRCAMAPRRGRCCDAAGGARQGNKREARGRSQKGKPA